ncbi:MAG TPA: phenylalanine--tRNA ligase beta subunit-related protein [Vicinamibacterales bacterium]|jgi:DNA/RNA-binding domain of Phe-tRNA-synthetase-like protein
MTFTLDPALASIVRPGVLWFEGATVTEHDHRMDAPLATAEAGVRINPPAETTTVRTMYKRVGIDPTKTRPSSEALLRRVRKGDTLPRINSMVDVCNWCSFEFQLPYGLYDAAHIEGDVTLRIGREGESYPGIRKDDVHVGGRIALVDAAGPFGNPTSDSARTMVTTATTRGLLVVFAPRDVDAARLTHVMDVTSERMQQFTGCRETARLVAG